jgi:hypothetical protein
MDIFRTLKDIKFKTNVTDLQTKGDVRQRPQDGRPTATVPGNKKQESLKLQRLQPLKTPGSCLQ